MSKRTYLIILGLGIFLRLLFIWQAGLWYDENFSLLMARLPLHDLILASAGDVHPPLYHLLIWPLGQIPNLPPWMIRLPSALFSIIALALYPRLLRDLKVPDTVQVVAFALLAVLPFQIHYAQEARMYSLMELEMVAAVIALLEDRRALLATSAAALLYTQNYGLFYVAALFLIAGSSQWSAFISAGLAWLIPWYPIFKHQFDVVQVHYWILPVTVGSALYDVWQTFWAFSLKHPAGLIASMAVTFAALTLGIWYLIRKRPPNWLTILWLALAPLMMAVIVSIVFAPILLFRALSGITPFLYLICAYPSQLLWREEWDDRWLWLMPHLNIRPALYAACFIAPVLVMSVPGFYVYNPVLKSTNGNGDMQQAISFIDARWQEGDVIYHPEFVSLINFLPYEKHPQFFMPDCTGHSYDHSPTLDALGINLKPFQQIKTGRVWLVWVWTPLTPLCEYNAVQDAIGSQAPALVLEDKPLVYSVVWLLEDK